MDQLNFEIHTFGCKVNTYDSGLIEGRLGERSEAGPKVHVLNTCAVTREATREAAKVAKKLKQRDPEAVVVVTGCAAQVDTEEMARALGVDLVVANSHKGQLKDLIRQHLSGDLKDRIFKSNIFKKEDLEPGGGVETGHTRSFLKIQDGCNSFCTFCVIPFARGKSRSLSINDICRRVDELVARDIKEIVLTGVHIADYRDGEFVLDDLVEAILKRTSVPRLRLTSLEPLEVSDRLLAMFSDSRLCRHFHMSIQSANSKVLRDMKRQYTADAVESSLKEIAEKVPGAFVGMDVIAGFPGESDEEFLDSYERLKRLPWTRLHVFPYSERPGTFAARRTDQVEPSAIQKRAAMLRELSDDRLATRAALQVGMVKLGLSLRGGRLLTRDYWPVDLVANSQVVSPYALPPNQEHQVRILRAQGGQLSGALI